MGCWMTLPGAGAAAAKLAPSRPPRTSRRATSCLPLSPATVSRRQAWQTILVLAPLVASASACSLAPSQAPPAPSPRPSGPWSPQDPGPGWKKGEGDLGVLPAEGRPLLRAAASHLGTRRLLADPAEESPAVNALWGSSEHVDARAAGGAPGSAAPSDLQVGQESSSEGPDPVASLSPARTANTLPRGPSDGSEQLERSGASSSLVLPAERAAGAGLSLPLAVPPAVSLPLLLRAARSVHLAVKTALPAGWVQGPAPPSPAFAAATVPRSENPTAHGHILTSEQDPHGKWPSSARMADRAWGGVDPSSAAPMQTGFLNSQHRAGDLTPVSAATLSADLRDSIPRTSAVPAASGGAHLDPDSNTEAPLSSAPHHEGSRLPPDHPVSPAVALTSSLGQPSVVEPAKPQWPRAASALPSGNDGFPVTSGRPKAASLADVATAQLATGMTALVPRSSAAGRPGPAPPLATTPLDLRTAAAGPPGGSHPAPGRQHAREERGAGFSVAPWPLRLGPAGWPEDPLSTLPTGRAPLEWKWGGSPAAGELSGAPFALGGGVSPQPWPASSRPPLGTLQPGGAETGCTAPLPQAGPPETAATSTVHGERRRAASYDGDEQRVAAPGLAPVPSSELPSPASETLLLGEPDPHLISAVPPAYLAGEHTSLPRRSDAAPAPPPNSTALAFSGPPLPPKDPAEPTPPAAPAATDGAGGAVTHRHAAPSAHSPTGTGEATRPPGIAAAGTARTEPLPAAPLASSGRELARTAPWPLELAPPASTPAAASPAGGMGRRGASAGPVGAALEARIAATEGQAAGGAQARSPEPRPSSLSLPVTRATSGAAPRGPTGGPEPGLQPSAATDPSDATVPELSTAPASLARDPTALPLSSAGGTSSSGSRARTIMSVSAARSSQALPVSRAAAALLTAARAPPGEPTAGAPSVPSRTTSARPLAASPSTRARKVSAATAGLADAKVGTGAALGTDAASLAAVGTTATTRAQSGSAAPEGRSTSQPVLTPEAPVPSPLTSKADRGLSTPTWPLPGLYALPLRFRLTRIDFAESLKNKSSEDYKRLEKELKLTMNKMLSAYEGFVQTNILRFLKGSVAVESEAVFQAGGPVPTSSDVLRTIVTALESGTLDPLLDWRVDIKSLWSNGFTLANLEPEKLAVSFAVLGAGLRTTPEGAITREYLESLKGQVVALLGVRYVVRNISLAQVGSSCGGTEVRGEVALDTDTHVDVPWALGALTGLASASVDLASLSIDGSRPSLRVFPLAFLVTNRRFDAKMTDRSSAEHQRIARDLSDVLMHILGKYDNLLQVAVREIAGGSLVCHADVIFQHPAPKSKDLLQTLVRAVGPKDYLDSSSLRVDRFSFTVAGEGLEPPFARPGVPAYGIAILALGSLALVALLIGALLPKVRGRKDKIIINRAWDPEAAMETFELDNPGFLTLADQDDGRPSSTPSETAS